MEFIFILFIVLVGGGWLLGKGIGNLIFGEKKDTYIDRSVHHHHHYNDNRSEHKHISIIDEQTKQDIVTYSEQREIKKATKTN